MNDQIPADKVRKIASEMRAAMRRDDSTYHDGEFLSDMSDYIRDLEALLPAPSRPTLADMTEEERRACQWMQCDVETWGRAVIVLPNERGGRTVTLNRRGHMAYEDRTDVTPRPDLPRLEWPGDQKPAPALPDGWLLADHQTRGRVIVTRPEPDADGEVAIIRTDPDMMTCANMVWCKRDLLTYIDADQEADQ